MADQHQPRPAGFRLEITRAGWVVMGAYGLLWLALFGFTAWTPDGTSQLTLDLMLGPKGFEVPTPTTFEFWQLLVLHPIGSAATGAGPGFQWWQLVSAPLLYPPPGFSGLLVGCLGLMFFAAPVERLLGIVGLVQLWLVACAGAVVGGLLVGLVFQEGVPFHYGFAPAVLAVMLVHCLMTPEASVPFFFVLHVKLKWLAVGIGTVVAIRALGVMGGAGAGGYELGGAVAGYLFWRSGADLDPRRLFRRRRARRNLRLAVDHLVETAGDDDDEPVFH
jgi:membrane associated rhomboid family serine protease